MVNMWEYGLLTYELGEDEIEEAWIFSRFDGSAIGPSKENRGEFNAIMFEIGQDGWEMITVVGMNPSEPNFYLQEFYFKRRVTDEID